MLLLALLGAIICKIGFGQATERWVLSDVGGQCISGQCKWNNFGVCTYGNPVKATFKGYFERENIPDGFGPCEIQFADGSLLKGIIGGIKPVLVDGYKPHGGFTTFYGAYYDAGGKLIADSLDGYNYWKYTHCSILGQDVPSFFTVFYRDVRINDVYQNQRVSFSADGQFVTVPGYSTYYIDKFSNGSSVCPYYMIGYNDSALRAYRFNANSGSFVDANEKIGADPTKYWSHDNLYSTILSLLPANCNFSSWGCGKEEFVIITWPKDNQRGIITAYKLLKQPSVQLTKIAEFGKLKVIDHGGSVSKDGKLLILSKPKNELGIFDLTQKGKIIATLSEKDFQTEPGFVLHDGGSWNDIKPIFGLSLNRDTLFIWERNIFIAYSISKKRTLFKTSLPGVVDPGIMSILGMWNRNSFYLEDISPDGKRAVYASSTMAMIADIRADPMKHYTPLINPQINASSFTGIKLAAAQLEYTNHAVALNWNAETKRIQDAKAKEDAIYWERFFKNQEKIQKGWQESYNNSIIAQSGKSAVSFGTAKKSQDQINHESDEKTLHDMDELLKRYDDKWGRTSH
jgi:hypothetical protein